MHIPTSLQRATAVAAAALVLASCAPAAEQAAPADPVDTAEEVADAVASSLAGSYRFAGRAEVTVDADEVAAAAAAVGQPVQLGQAERDLIDQVVDRVNAGAVTGARDADTVELGMTWRGAPVATVTVDSAQDLAALPEQLDADGDGQPDEDLDVEALQGVTVDVGLYGLVDLEVVQSMADEFAELTASVSGGSPSQEIDARAELSAALAPLAEEHPSLRPLVDALLASEPFGVDGELDLGQLLAAAEVSGPVSALTDQLPAAGLTGDVAGYQDHITYGDVDYDDATGMTTATVTLDVDQLMAGQAAASQSDQAVPGSALAQLQQLDLSLVVDLELTDGLLTSMRLRLLDNIEANLSANSDAAGPYGQTAVAALEQLDVTRLDLVVDYSEHGDDLAAPGQEATTVPWATLLDVLVTARTQQAS